MEFSDEEGREGRDRTYAESGVGLYRTGCGKPKNRNRFPEPNSEPGPNPSVLGSTAPSGQYSQEGYG
jgi:hypothetical protein